MNEPLSPTYQLFTVSDDRKEGRKEGEITPSFRARRNVQSQQSSNEYDYNHRDQLLVATSSEIYKLIVDKGK